MSTPGDFAGKIVVVYLDVGVAMFPSQPGWTLESPRFEEQHGRLFLVGSSASADPTTGTWHRGTTVHVSWASVTHYLVYESVESYRQAMGQFYAQRPKPAKPGWFGSRKPANPGWPGA